MFSILASGRDKRRGQSMVEFALVLPLMLTIFLGMTELGFIINSYLSQVHATSEAARYGSRLLGYPNANTLIVHQAVRSAGHLRLENLNFIAPSGANLGYFTLDPSGALLNDVGNPGKVGRICFFMYDNKTPDNFADDVQISCTNVNASYVKVKTRYLHPLMIPGINMLVEGSTFPLEAENVYPCTMMSIDRNDPNVGGLGGACPITVIDQPFIVGQTYILKGRSDEDPDHPGNFGWVNLDPAQPGNKNENIATWLLGPESPAVTVPGWIGGYTGERNAAVIKNALNQLSGNQVVILIHDAHQGNGANLAYHEIGFAIFQLENFDEQSDGGQPYLEITGTFVRRL